MSTQFPVKKFAHAATGTRLEGELILESSTGWQVAVAGKVQNLDKSEWSMTHEGSGFGGFEDIFSAFSGR